MKKAKILLLPLVAAMTVSTFTACTPDVNQGPEVSGANNITCLTNTPVDLLSGVSALDLEDGDITPDLQITITPEVAVQDGYAVFPKAGNYEVCYEVCDSQGKGARTTVNATVQEREVYMDSLLTNGFALKTGGGTKVLNSGLNGDVFAFKTQGQEIAEDIRLARTFTLNTSVEYTFKYNFTSNVAGRIKAVADGKVINANMSVKAGDNELEFVYTPEGETDSEMVEIELWLGGLEGDLEINFKSVETSYYNQPEYRWVDKISQFNFEGNVHKRFDGAAGNFGTVDGGKGFFVEVTDAADANWKGGVFANTGLALEAGVTYTFSYDVEADNDEDFEVILQNKQWDANEFYKTFGKGHQEFDFTIEEASSGTLWLYIASGAHANKITLKNLDVRVNKNSSSENLNFNDKVKSRFDGTEGNIGTVDGGKGFYVEITKTADANWKGGAFVDTGIQFRQGGTYVVSYDVEPEKDEEFEVVLQNSQWDEKVYDKNSESGHKQITVNVTEENKGSLWLYVASGAHENKITLKNLNVKVEKEVIAENFNFNDKVFDRFDGTEGNAGTVEDGKGFFVEVTRASADNWRGGAFANTEIQLEKDVTYVVTYDVEAETDGEPEVVLQNSQWDEKVYDKTFGTGHKEVKFTVTEENKGTLWLYLASGAHENKVTLKNLKVEVKAESDIKLSDYDFTNKLEGRFDGPKGNVEIVEGGKGVCLTVTAASDANWKGGVFTDTGLQLVSGVKYSISYDVEAQNGEEFEVVSQNMQWGANEFHKTFGSGHQEFEVTIDDESCGTLWLYVASGAHENKVTLSNLSVKANEIELTDILPEFSFDNKIEGRFDGTDGNVGTVENGNGVFVEITEAGDAIWRGGVFVNTEVSLEEGVKYTVSYDVEAENDGNFEVVLQNKQWDEQKYGLTSGTGHKEVTFTVTDQTKGSLWIYIQSGTNLNKITLKNLSVKSDESGYINQKYAIGSVYSNNHSGGEGSIKCEYGKIIYEIKTFGTDWGQNEAGTPSFALSGAAGNFVITFKAKATAPVSCVFAASVADEWNTFVWKQLKLTTEEQLFSVRCDDKGVEGIYKLLWQFGSTSNGANKDVTIEISDIKICMLSDLER